MSKAEGRKRNTAREPRRMAHGIAGASLGIILLLSSAFLKAQEAVTPQHPARGESVGGPAKSIEWSLLGYAIAPNDLLEVYVVGVPELSRTYRVSPFGSITLPMVNHPIAAAGLTPEGLSSAISDVLRKAGLVSDPEILVTVEASPRNSVGVTGSVKNPGIYPVFGQTTILDLLSQAGGLTADAGSVAIVSRGPKTIRALASAGNMNGQKASEDVGARSVKVDLRRLLETEDQVHNIALYPGDRVNVPEAGIIYVVGAVNRAGGFALTGEQDHLTVLQAIALAGNITRTALPKKTIIIRKTPLGLGGREQIQVDLKSILSSHAPDRQLIAGDILFVPDSLGKRAFASVISAATTLAIYRVPF
jgi:polysaccharide biosynthesis/export protein